MRIMHQNQTRNDEQRKISQWNFVKKIHNLVPLIKIILQFLTKTISLNIAMIAANQRSIGQMELQSGAIQRLIVSACVKAW